MEGLQYMGWMDLIWVNWIIRYLKTRRTLIPNKGAFKPSSQILDYQHTSHISFKPLSKVPCSHAVATAKAAVNDSPNGHTRALREFASVNPKDAEDGAHKIFKEYGLTIPLPIHKTDLGAEGVEQFPILKFSDWLRYLMDNCRFSQMCGVETLEEMMETLREFWVRFEKISPQHEIFASFRAGTVIPSLCLPVYSHTDEGRTYQKQGILIVSTHGALGRGTRSFIAKQVKKNPLKNLVWEWTLLGKRCPHSSYVVHFSVQFMLMMIPHSEKLWATMRRTWACYLHKGFGTPPRLCVCGHCTLAPKRTYRL